MKKTKNKRTINLGKDLRDKYEKGKLEESDVDSKGKAMYHVYSTGEKKDFMFIMETPGNKKDNGQFIDYVENGKLKYRDDFDKYVELKQKNFLTWIKELGLFNDRNIIGTINKELNEDINSDNFFEHFHVTDVRKCADGETSKCFNKFLKKEIEFLKPDLIFCFGRTAWDQIKACKEFTVEPTGKYGDSTKIKDLHGRLFSFEVKDKKVWIMPCLHFSVRTRNSAPRNSYIDYFKKGLTEYRGK